MANASQLNLKLGIDVSNLDRELGKVEKSLSKFGNSMKNIGSNLSQSLTVPIIGLGIASVKAFSDMEKLEKGLTAIMGSSELAKNEIIKLREVAKLPGLGLKEAVQGSINLQAVGLSAEEAKNTLMGFGTALGATNKGKVELEAIQYQLTQMISKNKILAEDYKVIQSNLPLMAEGMRAAFGTSNIEAIQATGMKAKDFVLQLANALLLLPETQNVTGSLANSFENLSDNIFISLSELGKTINESLKLEEVFTKVSNKIEIMVLKFKLLTPTQQENIVKFGLIAAAIGPVILIVGQLASSISSIIGLTRTLIGFFTILSGGTFLLVAAIAALVAYYAMSDEGQKDLSKTGALLSESFDRIKNAFQTTLNLLYKLQPLFDLLLLVFGKIVVFSFEFLITQINKSLDAINFLYDGVIKVLEALRIINKQKVGPEMKIGFGGNRADEKKYAGRSSTIDKKQPVEPIKPPPDLNLLTTLLKTPKGYDNVNNALKERIKINEANLAEINMLAVSSERLFKRALDNYDKSFAFNGVDGMLATLDLMPTKLESVTSATIKLKENTNALALAQGVAGNAVQVTDEKINLLKLSFEQLNTGLKNIIEGTLQDMAVAFGETLGQSLAGASFDIRSVIGPLADALIQFGKLAVQVGIAALGIKAALKSLNPAIAIAGGIALIALGTFVKSKLAAPKLAQGGLAYAPTMAMVGDNQNARVDPEVIAPLSKLKSMMGDMGVGGTLETRISGNDLIILLNRSQKGLYRVQ